MPDLSFHEYVTVAFFLSTLLFLAIASFVNGVYSRRSFALLAIVTGAVACIGMVSGPVDRPAWDDAIGTQIMRKGSSGGAGMGGGGAAAQGQAGGGRATKQAAAEAGDGGDGGDGADAAAGDKGFVRVLSPAGGKNVDSRSFQDCLHCPEMVPVQPGDAQLGGRAADPRTEAAELPQRLVRLAKRFAIGRTEITVAQFQAFTTATGRAAPACAGYATASGDKPAECMSYADAEAYIAWLSEISGRMYRLPSASEWEYAARAGGSEAYPSGDVLEPQVANIGSPAKALKTAGSYPANGFGLRDMVGSLAELVSDCWVANLKDVPSDGRPTLSASDCARRTLKDAAWWELPILARVSARRPLDVTTARPGVGFRVVRELD